MMDLTCLAVSEYARIIALECIIQNSTSHAIEHSLLGRKVLVLGVQ